MRNLLKLAVASLLMATPAFADIAAFNAKVQQRDFKGAAAEAAATWPGLDKGRADIALIAREFGFAAYLAGDHNAAKTFSLASLEKTPDGDPLRGSSLVLLRLAEMGLAPSSVARDALSQALTERSKQTGLDNISYLGADALVAYDFRGGRWTEAQADAVLAAKLAENGGPAFLDRKRRFELFGQAAFYMRTKDRDAHAGMVGVTNALARDIDAALDDAAAAKLAPVYWEARAWSQSMAAHLESRRVPLSQIVPGKPDWEALIGPKRASLPQLRPGTGDCPTKLELTRKPDYPASAQFKGFVGSVILKVDVDDKGMVSNATTLAAIPESEFARTAMGSVGDMRIKPRPGYNAATCSLAQKDRVVEFVFTFNNG
jgi:TonB family protein